MKSKSDTVANPGKITSTWPVAARVLVSLALLFHATAILAGVWASAPSSGLERSLADLFLPYNQTIDQGYSYRYFAPEPPPTPVLLATLIAADGRELETIRIPERGISPRMRYQRQLAIAREMAVSLEESRRDPHHRPAFWGPSFARELGGRNPDCVRVRLLIQQHLIPNLEGGPGIAARRREGPRPRRAGLLFDPRADRRIPLRPIRLLTDTWSYLVWPRRLDGRGLGPLRLPTGRPDPARPDPRGGRPARVLVDLGLWVRPRRLPRRVGLRPRAGRARVLGRAVPLGLVVLVPDPLRPGRAGLGGLPGRARSVHGRAREPGDGRPRLGASSSRLPGAPLTACMASTRSSRPGCSTSRPRGRAAGPSRSTAISDAGGRTGGSSPPGGRTGPGCPARESPGPRSRPTSPCG